jgi:hypothetical protein
MGELSFLTIIVSLAVCSLLVYAAFQYTKIRLTILEQSHKEQAMILQQFIEESSTDIHRLYTMSSSANGAPIQTNGSIILEYANNDRPVAYNEPHTIHLDTAFFQNKRNSNLIEISSDSEDTTDASSSDGSSDDDDESETSSDEEPADEYNEKPADIEIETVHEVVNDPDNKGEDIIAEIITQPEIKVVTVDLGISEEQEQEVAPIEESLSILSVSSQEPTDELVADIHVSADSTANTQLFGSSASVSSSASSSALSSMSVPDLKHMLKEKYKNQPEKHAEIQKLKKAELIAALQQIQ